MSVCLSACLFQLASGEGLLTILTSTIVGEYRRVLSVALLSQAKQSECGTVHFNWNRRADRPTDGQTGKPMCWEAAPPKI